MKKYILINIIFSIFISTLSLCDEKSQIELLRNCSGTLMVADFDRFDELKEVMINNQPQFVLESPSDNKLYGYFKTSILVNGIFSEGKVDKQSRRLGILVPAVKIGKKWKFLNPSLDKGSAFAIIDSMELGFDTYFCLKMHVIFKESILDAVLTIGAVSTRKCNDSVIGVSPFGLIFSGSSPIG